MWGLTPGWATCEHKRNRNLHAATKTSAAKRINIFKRIIESKMDFLEKVTLHHI